MINHHPSAELLNEYVAGSLILTRAMCVAAHIERCSDCHQQASKLLLIGANLFESQDMGTQSHSDISLLKSKVFSQLDELDNTITNTVANTVANDMEELHVEKPLGRKLANSNGYDIPKALQQFVKNDYGELDWTRVSPSIKIAVLSREKDGTQVSLNRVKPGGTFPHHRHTGDEITYLLEGSFSDESGIYRKGDFVHRDHKHQHKPIVSKDAECICLIVMDGPIQFTGVFARWLNPILRKNHPVV